MLKKTTVALIGSRLSLFVFQICLSTNYSYHRQLLDSILFFFSAAAFCASVVLTLALFDSVFSVRFEPVLAGALVDLVCFVESLTTSSSDFLASLLP